MEVGQQVVKTLEWKYLVEPKLKSHKRNTNIPPTTVLFLVWKGLPEIGKHKTSNIIHKETKN
jgi:hypothetical protein